jgi:hypothetical protein
MRTVEHPMTIITHADAGRHVTLDGDPARNAVNLVARAWA